MNTDKIYNSNLTFRYGHTNTTFTTFSSNKSCSTITITILTKITGLQPLFKLSVTDE